jgi:hypothetical protein
MMRRMKAVMNEESRRLRRKNRKIEGRKRERIKKTREESKEERWKGRRNYEDGNKRIRIEGEKYCLQNRIEKRVLVEK